MNRIRKEHGAPESIYGSEKWKGTRGKRLKMDNYQCQICFSDRRLHVHHLTYKRSLGGNEDPEQDLVTLCAKCHADLHGSLRTTEKEYRTTRDDIAERIEEALEPLIEEWYDSVMSLARKSARHSKNRTTNYPALLRYVLKSRELSWSSVSAFSDALLHNRLSNYLDIELEDHLDDVEGALNGSIDREDHI